MSNIKPTKETIQKAREVYLERTRPLYLRLFEVRNVQTVKYLFNHLNMTLEPIVFESNEEKLILSQIDDIYNQTIKEFNL